MEDQGVKRVIEFIIIAAAATTALTSPALAETACTVNDPTGTPLNVRQRPNGPILGALHNGTSVSIMENRGTWSRVTPREGKPGWVLRSYLDCQGSSGARFSEPPIAPANAEVDGNVILYACTSTCTSTARASMPSNATVATRWTMEAPAQAAA
jgi:uncharacterized protein YraI